MVREATPAVRVGVYRFEPVLFGRVRYAGGIILAQHPYESAKRYPVYGVEGLAVADSEHAGREAEAELQDLDTESLRSQVVSEFVNEDQEGQDRNDEQPGRQSEHAMTSPARTPCHIRPVLPG